MDDDTIGARFMTSVLAKSGHVCVNAFTVAEGLAELMKSSIFDVVILDSLLGDGTGPDFVRAALRELGERLPRIISVSGNSPEDQRRMYGDRYQGRIGGYLQKPVRKQDVLAMVQHYAAM